MMKFREHSFIKKLIETCNLTEKQAETFTDGMIEIATSCQDQLSTKDDIHELDKKIEKIETSINWIKAIGIGCLFLIIGLYFK